MLLRMASSFLRSRDLRSHERNGINCHCGDCRKAKSHSKLKTYPIELEVLDRYSEIESD